MINRKTKLDPFHITHCSLQQPIEGSECHDNRCNVTYNLVAFTITIRAVSHSRTWAGHNSFILDTSPTSLWQYSRCLKPSTTHHTWNDGILRWRRFSSLIAVLGRLITCSDAHDRSADRFPHSTIFTVNHHQGFLGSCYPPRIRTTFRPFGRKSAFESGLSHCAVPIPCLKSFYNISWIQVSPWLMDLQAFYSCSTLLSRADRSISLVRFCLRFPRLLNF